MRHPMMIAVLVTALAGQANGQPQNQARRSDPMAARLGRTVPDTPPSAWNDQDPADSLYRAAREDSTGGATPRLRICFPRSTPGIRNRRIPRMPITGRPTSGT